MSYIRGHVYIWASGMDADIVWTCWADHSHASFITSGTPPDPGDGLPAIAEQQYVTSVESEMLEHVHLHIKDFQKTLRKLHRAERRLRQEIAAGYVPPDLR